MRMKSLVLLMFVIFLMGGMLGYLSAKVAPTGVAEGVMNTFGEKVKTIRFAPFSFWSVVLIFINNLTVALLMYILGITVVLPSLIVLLNGAVAGVVVAFAENKGISSALAILSMVPHGIFELSAFFISASYGTMLGVMFWKRVLGKDGELRSFVAKMPFYVAFTIALLLLAAFIEAFISPLIFTI
ncbi:MAG: hypothetical protein GU347_04530 [Desulfurococcales archaeon]|nr:hypothetical protein [Desulfurococcales archaeon]